MIKSICKTHLMILGLALTATVNAGASASQCRTVAECRARIAQNQATLNQLPSGQAPTQAFLDIARNADGSVKYMNQADAIQYCANQGAHLPSARESAQLSMSLGAKGIVDVCDRSDDQCFSVKAKNADGSSDNFKFSSAGYQRPPGELGNNWFWSSSVVSYYSDYAFVLHGSYGDVVSYDRLNTSAVRCVSGR